MSSLTKQCKTCKIVLSIDMFHKNGTTRHPDCKICRCNLRKTMRFKRKESGTKCCNECKNNLDISEFNSDSTNTDGLQAVCKKCQIIRIHRSSNNLDVFINKLLKDAKNRANKKKIEFTINKDDINNLLKKQNNKCFITNRDLTFGWNPIEEDKKIKNPENMSIDRIIPEKGYNINNIRLVTARINIARFDNNDEEFIKIIQAIKLKHSPINQN